MTFWYIVGGLFLWQFIMGLIYGFRDGSIRTPDEFLADRKYNRELYNSGRANRNIIVKTSIRWDKGQDPTTASGAVELSEVIEDRRRIK